MLRDPSFDPTLQQHLSAQGSPEASATVAAPLPIRPPSEEALGFWFGEFLGLQVKSGAGTTHFWLFSHSGLSGSTIGICDSNKYGSGP